MRLGTGKGVLGWEMVARGGFFGGMAMCWW
jgi:hypothetical protein